MESTPSILSNPLLYSPYMKTPHFAILLLTLLTLTLAAQDAPASVPEAAPRANWPSTHNRTAPLAPSPKVPEGRTSTRPSRPPRQIWVPWPSISRAW